MTAIALSSSPQFASFRALVQEKLTEPFIPLKSSDGSLLNLFHSKISFDRSAIVTGVKSTGEISSQKDLIFYECPQLGTISASRDVILIRSIAHGKITAGRSIYCYDSFARELSCTGTLGIMFIDIIPSEFTYSNATIFKDLETAIPIIRLVNMVVKGRIIFLDKDGKPFRGKVIMDSRSRIEDLEHTDAEIIHVEDATDHKHKEKSDKSSTTDNS